MKPYLLFRQEIAGTANTVLPYPSEFRRFSKYIVDNGYAKELFNPQHLEAIPYDVRSNFRVFDKVFTTLADTVETVLTEMFIPTKNRLNAVSVLGNKLFYIVEESRTHLSRRKPCQRKLIWLANQIVADIEEIFEDPFGPFEASSVPLGSGSTQGMFVAWRHSSLCQKQ
jgi:hypothetical protein